MKKQIVQFFAGLFFFCLAQYSVAQKFSASVIMGVNAAQIDGDQLAGFHKPGIHGGLRVAYPLREKVDMGLELLYSQRGSRTPPSAAITRVTNLDYISIPLFINFKDWFIEGEDYYKVRAEAGMVYGYLFDADSSDDDIEGIEDFREHDFSLHIGASYSFHRKWTFTTRYTRSMNKLHSQESATNPGQDIVGLLGYFLTFRLEYKL